MPPYFHGLANKRKNAKTHESFFIGPLFPPRFGQLKGSPPAPPPKKITILFFLIFFPFRGVLNSVKKKARKKNTNYSLSLGGLRTPDFFGWPLKKGTKAKLSIFFDTKRKFPKNKPQALQIFEKQKKKKKLFFPPQLWIWNHFTLIHQLQNIKDFYNLKIF